MIVPMKKITIFMRDIEKTTSLRKLRGLGVMHINTKSVKSQRIDELRAQREDVEKICLRIEETYNEVVKNVKPRVEEQIRVDEVLRKRKKILEKIDDEKRLSQEISVYKDEIRRIESWGDFSPVKIHELRREGISLHFYQIDMTTLASIQEEITYIVLERGKKKSTIAVIGETPQDNPGIALFQLPEKSISEMQAYIMFAEKRLDIIRQTLRDEARYLKSYQEVIELIDEDLLFETVHYGMEQNGDIAWITGFIPEDNVYKIRSASHDASWGLIVDDISEEDQVPTKLKNNRLVRIIQPLFDMMGTVPGYREYDVSMFFLVFFSIFFAMIIGDAGYGMIFLLVAIGLHIANKHATDSIKLLYVLSGVTIVWGAITGTWFGSEYIIEHVTFLKNITIPEISSFPDMFASVTAKEVQYTVMHICFVLGILQLGIACIVNFLRELPRIKAIAQLGWLFLLIGLYYLVLQFVVNIPAPSWTVYLIGTGFIMFILFNRQTAGRSFIKGVLLGLGGLFTTFLNVISGFSNIISYIRLFAVGMATVAIASSFNGMAENFLGGLLFPVAILILLIGHGFNLIMGILSVVVHGVRLNVLEFSGQLGLEWTGIKYEPFKEHFDSSLEADSKLLGKE